jgi:hypothetical protein
MKTKILAIALTLATLSAVDASAGAIYGPNGGIVGYNHTGASSMMGAPMMGWAGMAGTSWKYDCRFNYYVLAY